MMNVENRTLLSTYGNFITFAAGKKIFYIFFFTFLLAGNSGPFLGSKVGLNISVFGIRYRFQ